MRWAMAALGFLALVGGLVQIPGVDDVITRFLEPVFADSPLAAIHPTVLADWEGLGVGGVISILGIYIAHWFYVAHPETPAILQKRLRPLYELFVNKWYFDEAIDILIVRPALAVGRFASRTFERVVVDGIVNGATDVVRGAGGIVRGAQSGFVRSYALLLIGGFAGLGLYFLIVSS